MQGSHDAPKVALHGEIVREDLPLPFVHYPRHYGTFLAFSESEHERIYVCKCAEQPLQSLVQLLRLENPGSNSNPLRMAPLPTPYVPDGISKASIKYSDDPLSGVSFRPDICHRCRVTPPSLRWCIEMYGGEFKQHFGWYIQQSYLRLGIAPGGRTFLPHICPLDYQHKISEANAARSEYLKEYKRIVSLVQGPPRPDIADNEIVYWSNVRMEEAQPMIQLRRNSDRLHQDLHNSIESITREEFGFRRVGEGWVSETLLYNIVSRLVYPEPAIRHFRPEWLDGLELDIYLPGRKVGIEYQGQQHFHPVEAWGGSAGLAGVKMRDKRKVKLCKQNGVHLILFDYTESLTEDYVRKLLQTVPEEMSQA